MATYQLCGYLKIGQKLIGSTKCVCKPLDSGPNKNLFKGLQSGNSVLMSIRAHTWNAWWMAVLAGLRHSGFWSGPILGLIWLSTGLGSGSNPGPGLMVSGLCLRKVQVQFLIFQVWIWIWSGSRSDLGFVLDLGLALLDLGLSSNCHLNPDLGPDLLSLNPGLLWAELMWLWIQWCDWMRVSDRSADHCVLEGCYFRCKIGQHGSGQTCITGWWVGAGW